MGVKGVKASLSHLGCMLPAVGDKDLDDGARCPRQLRQPWLNLPVQEFDPLREHRPLFRRQRRHDPAKVTYSTRVFTFISQTTTCYPV